MKTGHDHKTTFTFPPDSRHCRSFSLLIEMLLKKFRRTGSYFDYGLMYSDNVPIAVIIPSDSTSLIKNTDNVGRGPRQVFSRLLK